MVDSTFARDDVIAYLASAPIRREDGRPVPVDRWDLVSRRAGVVDGADWAERLERYAVEMAERDRERVRGSGESVTPDAPARPGSVAHTAVELAAFVAAMRSRLAELTTASGWRRRVELSRAALMDALGDPASIRRWPVDEQESFDAVLAALDRLADLDALEDEPAPGAFARAVDAELAAPSGRIGRFGAGVLCAPISAAVGLDLDAVAIVGLAEGLLPVPRREDALLADGDRRLAVDRELTVREADMGDQRRAVPGRARCVIRTSHPQLAPGRPSLRAGATPVALPARDRVLPRRAPNLRERVRDG